MPKPKTPTTETVPTIEGLPTVEITFSIPADLAFEVEDGPRKIRVPLAEMNAEQHAHVYTYGAGRFTRDGTTKITETVKGEDGKEKKVTRDATPAERCDLAEGKWKRLVDGTFKSRESGPRDYFTAAARTYVVKALLARKVAHKAIPKLPDKAAMEAAVAAFPGLWEKITTLATEEAERRRKTDEELSALTV